MNAENVLLTHFSARYPKMPPSGTLQPPGAIHRREPVLGLAFDQTRIKLCDMHKLGLYLPAIEQNFRDTKEEGDDDLDHGIAQTVEMDVGLLG
jgi:ribonuclease Z